MQVETSLRPAEERLAADPSEPSLEILEALKMKYDSHFGYIAKGAIINGLTVEFFALKAFWNFIGDLLVDSLNYSYECQNFQVLKNKQ